MNPNDAVIVSACRTPLGGFLGSLAPVDAVTLGSIAIAEAVKLVSGAPSTRAVCGLLDDPSPAVRAAVLRVLPRTQAPCSVARVVARYRPEAGIAPAAPIAAEILRQFEAKGLTINEGIAVDARLVKSASHPISNDKIKQARDKHNAPEGKLDKNGKPLKFHRDLDSDWVVQKDTPHYGLKEHASVDTNHGFVLATTMTPASVNDTNYLQYCTAFSRHTKQKIQKVFADKGYAGKPNRDFLSLNKIADGIMRKDSTTAKLTEYEKKRNKKISKVRYIVEQYFGISHLHDGAKRARFTDITKNKFDGWCRQAAFNIARGLKILRVATV